NVMQHKFSRIGLRDVADDAPAELKKLHGEAVAELKLIEQDRAKFLEERRKVLETDQTDLAGGSFKVATALRERLGKCLGKELAFRRDLLPRVLRGLSTD